MYHHSHKSHLRTPPFPPPEQTQINCCCSHCVEYFPIEGWVGFHTLGEHSLHSLSYLWGEHRIPGGKLRPNALRLGKIPLKGSVFRKIPLRKCFYVLGRMNPPYIQGVGF